MRKITLSEIVNLNRARKSKTRVAAKAMASANRLKFGLTKSRRTTDLANLAKAKRSLDQSRREP